MAAAHVVTAAFVKVSIGSRSGNRVAALLRRGDVVPDGVVDEQLVLLAKRDLIAEVAPVVVREPKVGRTQSDK